MPTVTLSPNAEEVVLDRITDPVLLERFQEQVQRIADSLATATEPAASPPFRRDRLMSNFRLDDSAEQEWTFVVPLVPCQPGDDIHITAVVVGGPEYDPHA